MTRVLILGVPRSGTTWIGRILGRTAGAAYVNEPDGFGEPLAFRVMMRRGEHPTLAPDEDDRDFARLWQGAFSGGRPAHTPRDRLARFLYARTPVDARRTARATGRAPLRLRAASALAVPTVAAPDARHVVVKSVQSVLSAEWVVRRHDPRVLVVERHPLNVLSSWIELGFVRSGPELERLGAFAQRRWGVLPPEPGAEHLRRQAFLYGVLALALREAADAHPEWERTTHEHLCVDSAARFEALSDRLGLEWGEEALGFLADSDQEQQGSFRTLRRTQDQPDRWRQRLSDEQVATIREELARFGGLAVPD